MNPSNHATGTAVFAANNIANPTALSATAPAGRSVGDLLVGITWCRSITATVSTPSGWNAVSGMPKRSGTASGGSFYVFTRTADGTSADNFAPSWSGVTTGTSGDSSGAVVLAYSNATATLDGGTIVTVDDSADTTTTTIPSFTTLVNNSMVIAMTMKILDTVGTSTVTTFTERVDAGTTSGTGHTIEISDKAKTGLSSAGAVGTGTITWTTNTTSSRAFGIVIGFKSVMQTGASTTALTDTITTSGVRTTLGTTAMALADTITTSGVRTARGVTATALAFSATTSGNVTAGGATVSGASAMGLTFGATTSGVRKALGSTTMALTVGVTTSAVRSAIGSTGTALTATFTTSGRKTTFGSSAMALTYAASSSGTRKALGASAMQLSYGVTTSGVRKTLGATAAALSFNATTSGFKSTAGASAMSLTDTFTTSAHKTTFGSSATGLTLQRTTAGTRTTFGSAVMTETVQTSTSGARATFGVTATALHIQFLTVSGGSFGSAGMALHFGAAISGIRTTYGATFRLVKSGNQGLSNEHFAATTTAHRDTFGVASVPLSLDFSTSGERESLGAVHVALAFVAQTRWGTTTLPGDTTVGGITFGSWDSPGQGIADGEQGHLVGVGRGGIA